MIQMRRSTVVIVACTIGLLAYVDGALALFGAALDEGTWEHVRGFTRIIIPDTFLYLQIAQEESAAAVVAAAGVKNSVGPSLLWWVSRNSWYAVGAFNIVCYVALAVYVRKLVTLLDPAQVRRCTAINIILAGVCTYYAVGALKEIPTLAGFTAFVYHFLSGHKKASVLWFVLLVLFRFQFSYLIAPVYFISRVRPNPLRTTLWALVALGALFPLFSLLDVFTPGSIEFFRVGATPYSDSLGAQVEYVRTHILGLSFVAIIIRIIQSIFEPVIQLAGTRSLSEAGSLSVYHAHSLLVLTMMLSSWIVVLSRRLWADVYGDASWRFGTLYAFVAIGVFATGGTGLISHRFLVPVYGLLLIAASVDPVSDVPAPSDGTVPMVV